MTSMLRFVSTAKKTPTKRHADDRKTDFLEIYDRFSDSEASEQASRCSQCGVPFCQSGCPLGNNIPDWLMLMAEGRLDEAYAASAATSTMPEICGRICPQDRLCEGACVIEQSGFGTVTIGSAETYITEEAWKAGLIKPIQPEVERDQHIGIIGSGPAGLAAADRLRTMGYQVTIYDRYDRSGGLLTYGIPGFKLEKNIVMRRVERLEQSGVTFKLGEAIGETISFTALRARHDAILIATGVYKAKELPVPGIGVSGVISALDYLTTSNRLDFGDVVENFDSGAHDAIDKNVVVIGGGDTAMDCVRTAIRQGAKSVSCVYRRDRENMPGSAREVANAEEEGVTFRWLAGPKAILGENGHVKAVRVAQMRLGQPDASGRQRPEEIAGQVEDIPADIVIKALGFDAEDLPAMFGEPQLPVRFDGTLRTSPATHATAMQGVFAAGDICRGASLVVWAVHDGQRAAEGIHAYISETAAPELTSKTLEHV